MTTTQLSFEANNIALSQLDYAMNVWFEPSNPPFTVTLMADATIARYFHRRPISRTQHIVTTHDDGVITLQIQATSEAEVLHEVKKWIPYLQIVSPTELKEKSKQLAQTFIACQSTT